MRLKLKRTPGIYLIGFMGCGKSTVGRALSDEIGWKFVDLDEEVERRENCSIPAIFEQHGEPAFRTAEAAALKDLVRAVECGRPHVISLGGGAFVNDANFQLVTNNGVSVWLDAPWETIVRRVAGFDHRPLARDPEKMRQLYDLRRPAYSRADYRLDVHTDDASELVQQILNFPLF